MMTPKMRSLASLAALLIISICAISSMDYSHVNSETTDLGGGIYRTEFSGGDPMEVILSIEGPRNSIGQPHGDDVEIIGENYKVAGTFGNGLRDGEFVYFDEFDQPTGLIETYSQGILVSASPEPELPLDRGPVYQIIARDRPWFLHQTEFAGVSADDLDAFLEELREGLAMAKPRNRRDFSLYLGLLLSEAEINHPDATAAYRAFASIEAQNHVKAFPLRNAVMDFYSSPASDLYGICANGYPAFVSDLQAYLPQGTSPKAFIDALEASLLEQTAPDPQDPIFPELVDVAIQGATADLDPESNFRVAVVLPFLLGEMGSEVDPVYQALYESVPFTGPLVLVGNIPGLPVKSAGFDNEAIKTMALTSRRAAKVNAVVEVSNQGNFAEALVVRGARSDRFFDVTYRGPGGNVTGALAAGGFQTPVIGEANAPISFRMEVAPNRRMLERGNDRRIVYLQKKITLTTRAASTSDATIVDAATVRVETKREVVRRPEPPPPLPLTPRGPGN